MEFKEFLFNAFTEWEKGQSKRRSSFSAYARWLSSNSYGIDIPQQLLDSWINGRYKPGAKYAPVLAEKLGDEIYDYLSIPRPDPLLSFIATHWEQLPPELQQKIHDEITTYLTPNDAPQTANT